VKSLSKVLLTLYLLILLWLVLFKFSLTFSAVSDLHTRSINLVPFAHFSLHNWRDVVFNCIGFIPFGLLLSLNLKQTSFWRKLAMVFFFSLAVEITQYIFAIGATDITDVITNTSGGLLGLILYGICDKYVDTPKLDRRITIGGIALLAAFILFAGVLLAHGVKFQSSHGMGPRRLPPMTR
jgi:glycopeptide antibiotics resistance protein